MNAAKYFNAILNNNESTARIAVAGRRGPWIKKKTGSVVALDHQHSGATLAIAFALRFGNAKAHGTCFGANHTGSTRIEVCHWHGSHWRIFFESQDTNIASDNIEVPCGICDSINYAMKGAISTCYVRANKYFNREKRNIDIGWQAVRSGNNGTLAYNRAATKLFAVIDESNNLVVVARLSIHNGLVRLFNNKVVCRLAAHAGNCKKQKRR